MQAFYGLNPRHFIDTNYMNPKLMEKRCSGIRSTHVSYGSGAKHLSSGRIGPKLQGLGKALPTSKEASVNTLALLAG
ncbi:hypothetical protein QW71_01120 [Paenibacillus sp. IHB B 3415]|nr:hypothetical protein QW71_01120 [Paenibacillus sp. IHB B 3415]